MESIIKRFLNDRFIFIRFYPEEIITHEPAVYVLNNRILSRDYFVEKSPENIGRFIEKYNQLKRFEFSSTSLGSLADVIIFENRSLMKSVNRRYFKNLIKEVIVNSLSVKVGFSRLFKELFALDRKIIEDITPKKITSRISCEAEIGEIVYVCVNKEKPYVSCPGVIVQKGNNDYLILYYTNLFGGKESKLLKINSFNFQTFNNRSFGKTRIQSIENRKDD
jgi:hypothetical protein